MPRISFVMPNRNRAEYLPQAIESLLEQTLKDIEIVIVDDDSTDDSRDIIDTYANKDKRIVREYLKPCDDKLPVGERIDRNRNIGNFTATAPIICVCDSDDWYLSRRAEVTYEAFRNDKELNLFYGAFFQRNQYGEEDERIPPYFPAKEFSTRSLRQSGLFFIGHITVGYKKETIMKYPYNSPPAGVGDWGMLYNLLVINNMKSYASPKFVSVYRVYNNSNRDMVWTNLVDKKFVKRLHKKKKKKMALLGGLDAVN